MTPPLDNIESEVFLYSKNNDKACNSGNTTNVTEIKTPNDPGFIQNPLKVCAPSGLKELIEYSRTIGDKIELRDKELNELIKAPRIQL